MIASSKIWNYHISELIYNIYEYNIFQNKKWIKFISITDPSFIKEKENVGHCMKIIDAVVNPYHIASF